MKVKMSRKSLINLNVPHAGEHKWIPGRRRYEPKKNPETRAIIIC